MFAKFTAYGQIAINRYTVHPAEFFGSLSLMALGVWLVIYPDLPAYAYLSQVTPRPVWGPLLFAVGFLSRLGLLTQRRQMRQAGMLAILFCRITLLGATGLSTNWISPTIPEHIAWCIVAIWAYARLDL